ncbi:TetR/AcrR family transcriptional regulator [Nocardia sp. NBC_01327]|uniref:TetR/AcrR family transcriptional regulator n=1 Tax=Nocardia sp. NBC_01327 TaxID=2903593 RepID=UPI002E11007B|nr:TetR/AcrR family transcriptional regulator [Nocardia sp. NBC_01327]
MGIDHTPPADAVPVTGDGHPPGGNAALATALASFEPSERRYPEGQRRVFLAAIEAFSERGFHATTTRDIAARAGLSPAGLYVHFRSKEAVLHRISLSSMRLTEQVAATAAARPGSIADRLAATVHDLTVWHAEHNAPVRVVLHHLTDLTPEHHTEVTAVQYAIYRILRDLVAEGATAGEFAITDPGSTTLALLSLCVDTARWYQPGYRRTPDQIGADHAALARRMVAAPTA